MILTVDTYVVVLTALTALTCGIFIWFAIPRGEAVQITQIRYFSHFFFFIAISWVLFLARSDMSDVWLTVVAHLVQYLAFFLLVNGFRVRAGQGTYNLLVLIVLASILSVVQAIVIIPMTNFIVGLIVTFTIWLLCCVLIYRALLMERNSKGKKAAMASLLISVCAVVIGASLIYMGILDSYEYAVFCYSIFYISLFGSISSLILSDEIAKQQTHAETDELTGLNNRRFFIERATKLIRSGRRADFPMCIILCDIDQFKSINDTFGHATGDRAIKTISSILADSVREMDMLARFGGEEFIVLLPQTDLQGAMDVAERMRSLTEQTEIVVPNSSFKLTSSFGVVEMIGLDLDANIMRADKALYHAKANGRNRVEQIMD